MMTVAEAQEWKRSRSRGVQLFLAREVLRGIIMFAVTSVVTWWFGVTTAVAVSFLLYLTLVAFVIWIGGFALFGFGLWSFQQHRYERRLRAEERGELRRTTGA
jgi:hypothetical protein